MRHRDFNRSGRWHTVSSEFRLTDGPNIVTLSASDIVVRWTTSEVAQGWLEYATTSAAIGGAGDSETTHETSYSFSTHTQTIPSLSPATTYYFRSVSISQTGTTVYSAIIQATTTGTQPPPSAGQGPRYDLYGAGASGDFPAPPGGWAGSGVVVVPANVATNANPARALSAFINAQATGAIIVLDSSGGGTAYGAGTLYTINESIWISGGASAPLNSTSSPRTDVTIWGYNAKVKDNHLTRTHPLYGTTDLYASTLVFSGGGFINCSLKGLTVQGPNTAAGTYACRAIGNETAHGLWITSYDGFEISDCYFYQQAGEHINLNQSGLNAPAHYGAYAHGPWVRNMTIQYNTMDGCGRMSIAPQQGYGVTIYRNIIRNAALGTIDLEDSNENPQGLRWVRSLTVEENIFDGWNWHINTNNQNYWWQWPMQGVHVAAGNDRYDDFVFRANEYRGGHKGVGNAPVEIQFWGFARTDNGPAGMRLGCVPAPWQTEQYPRTNVLIENEVSFLPADQLLNAPGSWFLRYWGGAITVRNNDFQGMPIRILNPAAGAVITVSGNATTGSSYLTSLPT